MRPALAALLFAVATVGLAADPVAVPDGKFADIKVAAPKGTSVVWRVYPPPVQRAPDLAPGRLIFAGKAGTTYLATAITIDFKSQTVTEEDTEVTFGGKAPAPPGPVPPGPTPPGPLPDGPAPIPEPGFRVLFVFEADDLAKHPRGQVNAMRSGATADYLAEKCVKGPDGKTPEYRAYDQHTPMEHAPKLWRDAMARPRVLTAEQRAAVTPKGTPLYPSPLPWVVISTGTTGYEGPIPYNPADPADTSEFMALLRKYGGN